MSRMQSRMKNSRAQACWRCGKTVPPGEGYVSGKPNDWTVTHENCVPVVDVDAMLRPWIKNLEYDL